MGITDEPGGEPTRFGDHHTSLQQWLSGPAEAPVPRK